MIRCASACAAVLAFAASAHATPDIRTGNFVMSLNTTYSAPLYVTDTSDPAAEDIEGMNLAVQIGDGSGITPSIDSLDLTTNTVWSNYNPGTDVVTIGTGPQFRDTSVFTDAGSGSSPPTLYINPNGKLATVNFNSTGASAGTYAVWLAPIPGQTGSDTAFSDGLGNVVPSTISNGTLTLVNSPVAYWNGSLNANWNASNWTMTGGTVPTSAHAVYFGRPAPATGSTLTLPSGAAANSLYFDGSYTLTGGSLALSAGNVTVFGDPNPSRASNVTIASLLTGPNLIVSGGGTLNLTDPRGFANDGTLQVSTPGTALHLVGPIVSIGNTTVDAGTNLSAAAIHQSSVTVNGIASINPHASGGYTSVLNSLTIAGVPGNWTGKLDLADNGLIVKYANTSPSPLSNIASQITSAYDTGKWDGNGIASSLANATKYGIGYAEATDLYGANGGTFMGQILPAGQNAVVVRWTLYGDLNLDGVVNLTDLNLFTQHFGQLANRWSLGDLNGDGAVNLTDLNLFTSQFGNALPDVTAAPPTAVDFAALYAFEASVPEPVAIVSATPFLLALLRRRR